MQRTGTRGRLLLATVLCLALSASAAQAQTPARLTGRVADVETGEAIAGAIVKIKNRPAGDTTDVLGRFEISGIPPGPVEVMIQALGYDRRSWKIDLAPGQVLNRDFSLDFNGEKLPEVVVTARAEKLMPRYVEFERRRMRGGGAFLRWDDILKKNFSTIGEAAQSIRGVRLVCNQETYECNVHMSRTANCPATWYVDGVEVSSFHENTPIRDVYGLEFYRGAAEVPAEFTGSTAGCGVVVVWTKSKPFQ